MRSQQLLWICKEMWLKLTPSQIFIFGLENCFRSNFINRQFQVHFQYVITSSNHIWVTSFLGRNFCVIKNSLKFETFGFSIIRNYCLVFRTKGPKNGENWCLKKKLFFETFYEWCIKAHLHQTILWTAYPNLNQRHIK